MEASAVEGHRKPYVERHMLHNTGDDVGFGPPAGGRGPHDLERSVE